MQVRNSITASIIALSCLSAANASAAPSQSFHDATKSVSKPSILSSKEKREFQAIYSAIQSQNWAQATKLISKADSGPMKYMARAELFLASASPRVEANDLQRLLNDAPWLPQAAQLKRLAEKRGADNLPLLPGTQRFTYLGEAPRRKVPAIVEAAGAKEVRDQIRLYIRNDQPSKAESYLKEKEDNLSIEALTEMQHRVAWSYYIENDDRNAQRMGALARKGRGVWAAQGAWAYGMASWRLTQYENAYLAFDQVSRQADNEDMKAAGLFWSSRAATAAKRPQEVQARLQAAAQLPETFYGLLASETLGMEPIAKKQLQATQLDWRSLKREENAKLAVGLSEIGQSSLADEAIKYQARIGSSDQHANLANLAGSLNLPSTQLFLGHYGPSKKSADAFARYPMPSWQPTNGWRVDPALAFAHTLQESQFRSQVVSPANAVGLMQVRPGTAGDIARSKGIAFKNSDLKKPQVNLEYGQSYMEKLRDMGVTQGLLPKVIAAYNAGPAPVARWNSEIRDNGDPLLYIESIPYWETRGYLTIILRNYWIYEMRAGRNGGSTKGLAQYMWPKFPSKNGQSIAVKQKGVSVGN